MDGPSRRPTDSSRSEGTPSLSEAPSGGAKTFWLLLGRLPKVTRCKSGTLSGRYRRNGYVRGKLQDPGRLSVRFREQARSHIWMVVLQMDLLGLEYRYRRQASSHIGSVV